ncbi:MAG: hypothetical protein RPU42_05500 [Candidatus Sedimenticola sp. (ex Thyasira tokunagai)]
MKEKAEIINPGFDIADGEDVRFSFDGDKLRFEFTDWKDQKITVECQNTIGFKYQWATGEYLDEERYDSSHIIHHSKWLKQHTKEGETWEGEQWGHYKLNFNAAGVMEILCSNIKKSNK